MDSGGCNMNRMMTCGDFCPHVFGLCTIRSFKPFLLLSSLYRVFASWIFIHSSLDGRLKLSVFAIRLQDRMSHDGGLDNMRRVWRRVTF